MKTITKKTIENYKLHLYEEEKSINTTNKYLRDLRSFSIWLGERTICKAEILNYKQYLLEHYAPKSVNSILSSLNSFFDFYGMNDLHVKTVKLQRQVFLPKERELTGEEYQRILSAALKKNDRRLYLLIQTICSSGIRVSELEYVTVDAVAKKQATIHCKGKMRMIMLPEQLCLMLDEYIRTENIIKGSVFVTRNGKPLDRSNIWKMLKALCKSASISEEKVFPHNLRHLFARTFYTKQKDIVRLADILGHSSINTTRIYTMETGDIHRRQIQDLGLVRY